MVALGACPMAGGAGGSVAFNVHTDKHGRTQTNMTAGEHSQPENQAKAFTPFTVYIPGFTGKV